MKEEDARLQEIARKRQQMLREEPAYLAKAIAKSKALTRLEEVRRSFPAFSVYEKSIVTDWVGYCSCCSCL